jgi:[ribosomal protein S5]-alanine N-acetyltransferase
VLHFCIAFRYRKGLQNTIPNKDAEEWFEVMKDPDMHLWTGNTVPANINDIRELLQGYKDNDNIMAWAVIDKLSDKIIGTYWIWKPILEGNKRIIQTEAQRISNKYWRKGYTTEARKLVYKYAFEQLQVDEIHAGAWANNVNSCKSMENIGFKLLEKAERLFNKYNKVFEENHYVLYRAVWEKHKV